MSALDPVDMGVRETDALIDPRTLPVVKGCRLGMRNAGRSRLAACGEDRNRHNRGL